MLRIEKLSKLYGNLPAVDNVSFSLESGTITALLGVNGAGKTTTLRMLTGYVTPTAGAVYLKDENLMDSREKHLSHIGYLPETPALYNDMTVADFLLYMFNLRCPKSEDAKGPVEKAMAACGLTERANDFIASLSAGFRKRVGFAQALIHNPQILLLDEPLADLDPRQIREIKALLQEIKKDRAVLVSSHILKEVHEFADRILLMHEGKILAECGAADIPPGELENWFLKHTESAA